MKKLILLSAIFLLIYNSSFSQNNKLYRNACKYLVKNNLNDNTPISDSIVYIEYSFIFDLIKKDKISAKSILDSLINIDSERVFVNFKNAKNIFTKYNKYAKNKGVVFLSKPYKNTLLVEVFTNGTLLNSSYSSLKSQNISHILLLYFDKKSKFINHNSIEINYD